MIRTKAQKQETVTALAARLKRTTTLNTLVGAIPGAIPPVIGWAAVRGSLGAVAGILTS